MRLLQSLGANTRRGAVHCSVALGEHRGRARSRAGRLDPRVARLPSRQGNSAGADCRRLVGRSGGRRSVEIPCAGRRDRPPAHRGSDHPCVAEISRAHRRGHQALGPDQRGHMLFHGQLGGLSSTIVGSLGVVLPLLLGAVAAALAESARRRGRGLLRAAELASRDRPAAQAWATFPGPCASVLVAVFLAFALLWLGPIIWSAFSGTWHVLRAIDAGRAGSVRPDGIDQGGGAGCDEDLRARSSPLFGGRRVRGTRVRALALAHLARARPREAPRTARGRAAAATGSRGRAPSHWRLRAARPGAADETGERNALVSRPRDRPRQGPNAGGRRSRRPRTRDARRNDVDWAVGQRIGAGSGGPRK